MLTRPAEMGHAHRRTDGYPRPRARPAPAAGAWWLAAACALALSSGRAQEAAGGEDARGVLDREVAEKVLIVPVRGIIDEELVADVLKKLEYWLEREPAVGWVVLEIDAEGDDYAAGRMLGDFLLELRGKRTIAFVPPGGKAFGAAVLPLLAARDVALGINARLGGGETVNVLAGEETLDGARRVAERYAARQNRPQLLAAVLVSKARENVYRLRRKAAGAGRDARYDFWYQSELNTRDPAERNRRFEAPVEILRQGQYLNLDQATAYEYGMAQYRGIEEDHGSYAALRNAIGLHVPDAAIIHAESGPLERGSSYGQLAIDILNSPLARFLLILGGFLGLLLEIKMLGTVIPGLAGLACFTVLFVSGMFPVTGAFEPTTTWFEALLFAIGLGLVAIEFLLLPGVGVFALGGALLAFVSLILAMVPSGDADGTRAMGFREALETLAGGFGASGLTFLFLLKFLPRARWLSGGLVTRASIEGVPGADSALESQSDLSTITGKTGTAATPLRPAGKVLLDDGKFLDVVAEGQFIEKGEKVIVEKCTSTRIIVSRVE